MNGQRSTKIVKAVRKKRTQIEKDLLVDILLMPFGWRLKYAWKVLKGRKKPKYKRTRRERKRVLTSGQQGLTKDSKNIKKKERGADE